MSSLIIITVPDDLAPTGVRASIAMTKVESCMYEGVKVAPSNRPL